MSYVTAAQYGRVMRLHPVTVRRLCREGKVAGAVKIGAQWRIKMEDPMQVELHRVQQATTDSGCQKEILA